MSCFPLWANSGRYSATGSLMRNLPCSQSCMIAVVVATTLVSEAQSNTVSSVIASRRGTIARLAVCFAIHDLPFMANNDDRTRNLLLCDGIVDDGIENAEAGIKRSLGECGGRKQES